MLFLAKTAKYHPIAGPPDEAAITGCRSLGVCRTSPEYHPFSRADGLGGGPRGVSLGHLPDESSVGQSGPGG